MCWKKILKCSTLIEFLAWQCALNSVAGAQFLHEHCMDSLVAYQKTI